MTVRVDIPTVLRPYTDGERQVAASGADLAALIADLESRHEGLSQRLLEGAELRRFVNVYVNEEDVRFLGGLDTELAEGDVVIVAGFQGVSQTTKDVTTLGRGASDTTAVALAAGYSIFSKAMKTEESASAMLAKKRAAANRPTAWISKFVRGVGDLGKRSSANAITGRLMIQRSDRRVTTFVRYLRARPLSNATSRVSSVPRPKRVTISAIM